VAMFVMDLIITLGPRCIMRFGIGPEDHMKKASLPRATLDKGPEDGVFRSITTWFLRP
jgi:hypothetical protein